MCIRSLKHERRRSIRLQTEHHSIIASLAPLPNLAPPSTHSFTFDPTLSSETRLLHPTRHTCPPIVVHIDLLHLPATHLRRVTPRRSSLQWPALEYMSADSTSRMENTRSRPLLCQKEKQSLEKNHSTKQHLIQGVGVCRKQQGREFEQLHIRKPGLSTFECTIARIRGSPG